MTQEKGEPKTNAERQRRKKAANKQGLVHWGGYVPQLVKRLLEFVEPLWLNGMLIIGSGKIASKWLKRIRKGEQ